jgi:polyisoprenoid-binding protein YceI
MALADPAAWSAVAGKGQILVHVFKHGLLSGLAHDHHFSASAWRATASFDPEALGVARIEVVVSAGSLQDGQEALSAKEREQVYQQATGPETLDAAHFPEILFVADRLAPAAGPPPGTGGVIEGALIGTLTLRGHPRRVELPVRASREGEGWRARGSVRLKQSDFGIAPFSGFLGTVRVRDEIEIEYDLLMAPAG